MRHTFSIVIVSAALVVASALVLMSHGCGQATSADVPAASTSKTERKATWDYVAELKKLLPANDKIAGWKLVGEPTVVEGEKLLASGWERAPQFRPYGLRYRMTATFNPTAANLPSMSLDVYFMEASISSFGVFASTRTLESNFVKMGNQGIEEEKQLRWWKGPLYAELNLTGDGAVPKGFLNTVAKDVASRMVMPNKVPDLLMALPGRGLIANSQKYAAFDGFGQKAPRMAVIADYSIDGANFRVATTQTASPADAAAIFQTIRASIESTGQQKPLTIAFGEETLASATLADRMTFFVRQGQFMTLVENVAGEQFAADILKESAEKMTHLLDQQELDDEQKKMSPPAQVHGH
ncbi:MAG: hypothetical protein HYR85_25215 [Planctomycetes bacterium]|nr:hypothetical protein [Planctomycetota bacterium]MBI3843318.1 hypothetical protein [Planctomycetota bacterium]